MDYVKPTDLRDPFKRINGDAALPAAWRFGAGTCLVNRGGLGGTAGCRSAAEPCNGLKSQRPFATSDYSTVRATLSFLVTCAVLLIRCGIPML
eukprot:4438371-Amphidinium_carterae.2